MKTTFAGRKFQFWEYRVSHGELLVRSPKGAGSSFNVDLMFVGVEYVDLPRFLPELEVDEPTEDDLLRAKERLGKAVEKRSTTVLKCQGRRHVVVATAVSVSENDMDIFDSPFKDQSG